MLRVILLVANAVEDLKQSVQRVQAVMILLRQEEDVNVLPINIQLQAILWCVETAIPHVASVAEVLKQNARHVQVGMILLQQEEDVLVKVQNMRQLPIL